jgi:very-short-patch-repair endonuclease
VELSERTQVFGVKFKRQEPIGRYIVDFISYEKSIIIELDGGQHVRDVQKDKIRDEYLRKCGYKVLRFWDNDALKYTESVLEAVRLGIFNPPHPYTSPARGEGEKGLER